MAMASLIELFNIKSELVVNRTRQLMTSSSTDEPPAAAFDNDIPKEMKRLVVTSPGNGTSVADCTIEVQTVPTPVPGPGEVLIKVVAAPVNPSDYGTWMRAQPSSCSLAMGKEGCGVVVATGGGLTTYRCPVGTRCGFTGDATRGTYAEYVAVNALTGVFPMPDDVPLADCAAFLVNPYTAVGILDTAKADGSGGALVHTAAASQLGQMLNRLALQRGVEIINVVRREEQKALLEALGAKHVVVTAGDADLWKAELKAKAKELGASVAFDAVAGDMTGHLLECLPRGGTVRLYGGLAGRASHINPMDLIYKGKALKAFFLTNWLQSGGPVLMVPRLLAAGRVVNGGLQGPDGWCCSTFQDTTPERAQGDLVALLGGSATGKKLRIRFDGEA